MTIVFVRNIYYILVWCCFLLYVIYLWLIILIGVVLIACGKNKEDAVKGMIEGPVTPELPASVLQNHKDVTVIIDKAAAALLEKEY